LKGKSPRYSYGKESDYGYVSGKSRDTLCNSATIDTISNLKPTTLSTSYHNELTNIENNNNNKTNEEKITNESYLRESISSDCINNENKIESNEHNYTMISSTNKALNTSPTASTSSYSSSSSSTDPTTKDLHASLPIMTHSNSDDYATQAHILSMSLNIPKANDSTTTTTASESSVSSSASSVMFTNSYCSNDENNKHPHIDNIVSLNDISIFNRLSVDIWQNNTIKDWLEHIGMLPIHVKNCLKYVKSGKV
jgi:hypothetical protein